MLWINKSYQVSLRDTNCHRKTMPYSVRNAQVKINGAEISGDGILPLTGRILSVEVDCKDDGYVNIGLAPEAPNRNDGIYIQNRGDSIVDQSVIDESSARLATYKTELAQNTAFKKLINSFTVAGSYPQKQEAMTKAVAANPNADANVLYAAALNYM